MGQVSQEQQSLTSMIPIPVSCLEGQAWPGMSLAGNLAGQEQEEVEPKLCLSPICSSQRMDTQSLMAPVHPNP